MRLIGIFFFSILVIPIIGLFSYFYFLKNNIKKDVKKNIVNYVDKQELILFNFSENDKNVFWNNDKEFEYKGKMYDVVFSTKESNYTSYWCYSDEKETQINQQIDQLVNQLYQQNSQRQETQKQFLTYLKTLYVVNLFDWNFLLNNSFIQQKYPIYHQFFNSNYIFKVFLPPKF